MNASERTIHVVNGYEKDAYTYYPVLIVGGGASGIAMGCQLKEQLGFDQFRIFERQSGLGGTWWINRYPGVAVDVPAIFYSFSFAPNYNWTTFFPPGPEIIKYLHDVCDKYQIVDKIQLNTDVSEIRWLEDEQLWEVFLTHMAPGAGDLSEKERQQQIAELGEQSVYIGKEIVRAKIVASAVGGLVEPKGWPDSIPGRENFEGDLFHSARWRYDVDLNGKDVIVLGTGCSAAQFATLLPKEPYNAKSVTHLMRSPPWVVPKAKPPFGPEAWGKWSKPLFTHVPGVAKFFRTFIFLMAELDWFTIFLNTKLGVEGRQKIEADLLKDMKAKVPEKYHEILTPDYGVGCKRRIFDEYWFEQTNDPRYHLTTQPLTKVNKKSVTLGPGRTYPDMSVTDSKVPTDEREIPADVIILANGFDLTRWLHPLKVRGRGGKLLQDVWDERGGVQAYMGNAMDNFPNFFIIFGPNTATGHSSVILCTENMVNYSLKFIKPILNGDVRTVEVKKSAEVEWTRQMQEELKDTVWSTGGCHSWYQNDIGWNATVYPRSQIDYSIRCMFPKWSDWNISYTTKGLWKQRIKRILALAAFAATIVGAFRLRQSGMSIKSLPGQLQQFVRSTVLQVLGMLRYGIESVQTRI